MTPGLPAPADKRFRRARVKPAGRRGSRWRQAVSLARRGGFAMLVGFCVWRAAVLVVESPVMAIAHINIRGLNRLSRGEALALLADLRGQHILGVRLDDWRQRLLTSPWVEDVLVRRVLPNTMDVTISERTPMGIARLGRDLFLVDRHGVVIDEYGPRFADLDLPVIDGLGAPPRDGRSLVDERRTALVARLLGDVAGHQRLSSRVSQIDVHDASDAVVLLDGDTVLLRLGDRDFAARLQDYLDLAPALRERVSGIESVDLRFGQRLYVRPSRGGGSGATPVSRDAGQVGGQ